MVQHRTTSMTGTNATEKTDRVEQVTRLFVDIKFHRF